MIISLCGSSRFEPWFHIWNEILSLSGHLVFSQPNFPSQKSPWFDEEEKEILDSVYKEKIRKSDAIFVINTFAYIGERTRAEIDFASRGGRYMYFTESWGKGCGITERMHLPVLVEAARFYGLEEYQSPIDTWANGVRREPYSLLPPAGALRNKLVNRLSDFEAKFKYGGAHENPNT